MKLSSVNEIQEIGGLNDRAGNDSFESARRSRLWLWRWMHLAVFFLSNVNRRQFPLEWDSEETLAAQRLDGEIGKAAILWSGSEMITTIMGWSVLLACCSLASTVEPAQQNQGIGTFYKVPTYGIVWTGFWTSLF